MKDDPLGWAVGDRRWEGLFREMVEGLPSTIRKAVRVEAFVDFDSDAHGEAQEALFEAFGDDSEGAFDLIEVGLELDRKAIERVLGETK